MIMQGVIDGKVTREDTVSVDLWYTNVYELYQSKWNLINMARMQDIFDSDGVETSRVTFQPRSLFWKGSSNSEEQKRKNKYCVQNGKYCPEVPDQLRLNEDND